MLLTVNAGSIRQAMRPWPRQGLEMYSRALLGPCSVRGSTPCRLPSVVSICMVLPETAYETDLVIVDSSHQMCLKNFHMLSRQPQGERHAAPSDTTLADYAGRPDTGPWGTLRAASAGRRLRGLLWCLGGWQDNICTGLCRGLRRWNERIYTEPNVCLSPYVSRTYSFVPF